MSVFLSSAAISQRNARSWYEVGLAVFCAWLLFKKNGYNFFTKLKPVERIASACVILVLLNVLSVAQRAMVSSSSAERVLRRSTGIDALLVHPHHFSDGVSAIVRLHYHFPD